jgi:AraC-like DNA-binding protein
MSSSIPGAIDGHPEAASLDNPFKRRLSLSEDLRVSAEWMGIVLPILELVNTEAEAAWWHYGFGCALGSIRIAAMILPPARMVVAGEDSLHVFISYGGEQKVRQQSSEWLCKEGDCLILPGKDFTCENRLLSSVVLQVAPEHVLHTAMAMAGISQIPSSWRQAAQQGHAWGAADSRVAPLLTMLRLAMAMAEPLADSSQSLIDRLQPDDQIHRLLAALMLPELREEDPLDRLTQRDRQGRDSFDELIDYIKLNLAEPLNLTMLESRSHYSRRALQYAFRDRLGCTATQWIRNQRLDLARQRLQNPRPGETVTGIATLCGYRSMNLFSVDFQQRFHVRPSQLLREARSSLPPDTWLVPRREQ